MNSTLIIILSETRAHEEAYELMQTNLIQVCGGDLALCIADNEREVKDNPFYRDAKYVWQYPEPDDWGDAFDEMQKELGSNENWRLMLQVKDQWLGGIKGEGAHPGSAGILLFFRYFLKTCILKDGLLDKYDRFIIIRFCSQNPTCTTAFFRSCPYLDSIW